MAIANMVTFTNDVYAKDRDGVFFWLNIHDIVNEKKLDEEEKQPE